MTQVFAQNSEITQQIITVLAHAIVLGGLLLYWAGLLIIRHINKS